MKKVLSILVAFVFVILVFSSAGLAGQKKNDVYGYFFIHGPVPVAFRNIAHLSLDGSYGKTQKPPTYGRIRLKGKSGTDYVLSGITIRDMNLSFKTRSIRGVHYEFNGVLTTRDFDKQPAPDVIVLRGTLKKMLGQKVSAESKVEFTWELGD